MRTVIKQMDKRKVVSIATLVSSLLFYVIFAIVDGAVICADSPSYINMSISREPLYPTFLAILRSVFGVTGDTYLYAVAIVQCILAGICTWAFVDYVVRESKIDDLYEFLFLGICFSVSLLCRFVAQRGSMYNTCIMTESICIPLFMLFSRYILEFLVSKNRHSLIVSTLLSLLMILTRKQMYITLAIIVIAILYAKAIRLKSLGAILICLTVVLGGNKALDYAYNMAFHDGAYTHFNDNRFLTTVVFYVSERENGTLIEDAELRKLFLDIYDVCDSENSMLHSAGDTIYDKINHFGDHYDMIQINHMQPMIREYVLKEGTYSSDSERETRVDAISDVFAKSIMPAVWPRMVGLFFRNVLHGLVNTVGKATIKLMYPFTLFILAVYVYLTIKNLRSNRNSFDGLLAVYTLLAIMLNVTGVSATIFCQVRYMIYMMPLFYIALALLVIGGYIEREDR